MKSLALSLIRSRVSGDPPSRPLDGLAEGDA